jgi:two-component system response regulator HydG
MQKILIADDQQVFLKVISRFLSAQGYQVVTACSGQEALDILKDESFDLLISDIRMEPVSGMDLLQRVQQTHKELCVIMLTACETVAVAIDAMKLGAFDYLTKPVDLQELSRAVQRAFEYSQSANNRPTRVKLEYHEGQEKLDGMVAHSHQMLSVCEMIERMAPTCQPVLLCGEPGSGTELAARTLHRCSSRADMPFLKVDCAAIPPELLEGALFGESGRKEEGLYLSASGGTLFLREIGKMPLPVQQRLVQVMEQQNAQMMQDKAAELSVRLISTSSENMQKLVNSGKFMEELYRRIRAFYIPIPPLRDREEDVVPLVARIVHRHMDSAAEMPTLDGEAEKMLKLYRWPGNVEELITTVQYALSRLENNTITRASLPAQLVDEASVVDDVLKTIRPSESLKGKSLQAFLHDEKRGPIRQVMKNLNPEPEEPAAQTPASPQKKDPSAAARDDDTPFKWI